MHTFTLNKMTLTSVAELGFGGINDSSIAYFSPPILIGLVPLSPFTGDSASGIGDTVTVGLQVTG